MRAALRIAHHVGMNAPFRIPAAILAAALACGLAAASPAAAPAATGGTFQTTANPGGGTIITGTLGYASISAATAQLMRRVHAALGTRPAVLQVAQNRSDRSLALLFTADRSGTPYTGIAIVTASPGAQAGGAALY